MSTQTPQAELARILRDLRRSEASGQSSAEIQLLLEPLCAFIDRTDREIKRMRCEPEPSPDEHQKRIEYQCCILPYERALATAHEERWKRSRSLAGIS